MSPHSSEPGGVATDSLLSLLAELRGAQSLALKRDTQLAAAYFPHRVPNPVPGQPELLNGDDAAAIPDGDGYLLLAAEGMQPRFVKVDPWFAGFSAVMVNVSDIAAMGGRALAIVDVLFAGPAGDNHRLLAGMRDASEAFGVPIVGGHTGRSVDESVLAVAIVGKAKRLLSGFAARPGQVLLYAVDLCGAYRGKYNFNAATHSSGERLRANVQLLPELSEAGLLCAGKDVSMAGLLGTLAMLCEASACGARVQLDAIPKPHGIPMLRWLLSFPSFGFLLCVNEGDVEPVRLRFQERGLSCAVIGNMEASGRIIVQQSSDEALYWSRLESVTGYSRARAVLLGKPGASKVSRLRHA